MNGEIYGQLINCKVIALHRMDQVMAGTVLEIDHNLLDYLLFLQGDLKIKIYTHLSG